MVMLRIFTTTMLNFRRRANFIFVMRKNQNKDSI